MVDSNRETTAIRAAGFAAGTDGRGPMENPYPAGSVAFNAWRDGWRQAYGYTPPPSSPLDVGPL